MRLVTFTLKNQASKGQASNESQAARLGALSKDNRSILDFSRTLEAEESGNLLDWFDLDKPLLGRARTLYDEATSGGKGFGEGQSGIIRRADVQLLAPVPRPGKLICIGLNYRDHAIESNMPIPKSPMVFSKFATSVIGPDQSIVLPASSEKVDYEAELAVVIGRRAKNVSPHNAFDHVLGYTNLNDVSARDFQFADVQWQRGKSCDTFAPMGEYIATADEIPDPHNLSIRLRLNGETMQDSTTAQLIFQIPELIVFLSETITLEPGDVIATGTPFGVGFARKPPVFLKAGDRVEVEVEGLGVLSNTVMAQSS